MNDPSIRASTAASPPTRRIPVLRFVMLAGAVALVAAISTVVRERSQGAMAHGATPEQATAERIIPVVTAPVERRDVPIWLEGLGSVTAFYTVTVKSQVDGRIDKVLFQEGQNVRKGDLLVQIDPRPFAIQLQSAQAAIAKDQAQLKNAELNFQRNQALYAENLASMQQLTDTQATVSQANGQLQADQALVSAAKLNLDYSRITSPIDGVVGLRQADPGNLVHASDTSGLVVVTQLDPIAVLFTLPEDDLTSIREAMSAGALDVEARSRDGDKTLATGRLSVIDNEINQATATIRLKAIFANSQRLLWPNQFVKARLRLRVRENAVVVPAAVVQRGPQGSFAYVVANSVAVMRPINVDATQGDLAVIAKGLEPGEQVVIEGQAQIRPGSRVAAKLVPSAPSGSASADARGATP